MSKHSHSIFSSETNMIGDCLPVTKLVQVAAGKGATGNLVSSYELKYSRMSMRGCVHGTGGRIAPDACHASAGRVDGVYITRLYPARRSHSSAPPAGSYSIDISDGIGLVVH